MKLKERIISALMNLLFLCMGIIIGQLFSYHTLKLMEFLIAVGMGLILIFITEAVTKKPHFWRYVFNWGLKK